MATILTYGNSEGSRRCDAHCHEAAGPICSCVCGGTFHGGGRQAAEAGAREYLFQLAERTGDADLLDVLLAAAPGARGGAIAGQ